MDMKVDDIGAHFCVGAKVFIVESCEGCDSCVAHRKVRRARISNWTACASQKEIHYSINVETEDSGIDYSETRFANEVFERETEAEQALKEMNDGS